MQRSLGRATWACAGILALLAAFQLALIAEAVSLVEQGAFGRLEQVVPGFVRDVLESALTSCASEHLGLVCFNDAWPK